MLFWKANNRENKAVGSKAETIKAEDAGVTAEEVKEEASAEA